MPLKALYKLLVMVCLETRDSLSIQEESEHDVSDQVAGHLENYRGMSGVKLRFQKSRETQASSRKQRHQRKQGNQSENKSYGYQLYCHTVLRP